MHWVRKLMRRRRKRGDGELATWAPRATVESQDAGGGQTASGGAIPDKNSLAKLWHDYGPTLAAEELAEDYGIAISRGTLRRWLIEAQLWRPRRAPAEPTQVWRPRGGLVMASWCSGTGVNTIGCKEGGTFDWALTPIVRDMGAASYFSAGVLP